MTHAIRSYGLLFKWECLRMRSSLALIVVIQVLLAIGVVYGLSFLLPNISQSSALYLATGAPTLSMLILGITVVPQEVARSRDTGRDEYLRALPLPALSMLAASLSFWLLANLPGTALSLWVAKIRFDIDLNIDPVVLAVIVLVALTAGTVGYALAQSISPQATQQITSFISIGILLFSPINFPLDRLPSALQTIHEILPISYMADLVRWSLTGRAVHDPTSSFIVVGAWCAAGLSISYRVATRRR